MQKQQIQSIGAVTLAVVGLALGTFSALWLTGTLGVSGITARAIASAVEAGSWAMFLVAIAATGGLVGAGLWGVLKLMMWRSGRAAVVA